MPSPSPHSFFVYTLEMVEELGAGVAIGCPLAGGSSLDFLILRWRLDSSVTVVTRIQTGVNEESGRGRGMFFRESIPVLGHTRPPVRWGLFTSRPCVRCLKLTIQWLRLRMSGSEPYLSPMRRNDVRRGSSSVRFGADGVYTRSLGRI